MLGRVDTYLHDLVSWSTWILRKRHDDAELGWLEGLIHVSEINDTVFLLENR